MALRSTPRRQGKIQASSAPAPTPRADLVPLRVLVDFHRPYARGEVAGWPEADARVLVAAGIAEALDAPTLAWLTDAAHDAA